jgi:hypothetical protein
MFRHAMEFFRLSQMIHNSIVYNCQEFQSKGTNIEAGEHRKTAERHQSYGFLGHIWSIPYVPSRHYGISQQVPFS